MTNCTATSSNPPTTTTTRPPTTTTTAPAGCSTKTVYKAKNGACVASYVDGTGDVDCGQLPSAMKPVSVLNPGNDPYQLDSDGDGVGCESG
ncbi:hypothetical protein [Aquihabitans sp. McL0605]|uniref:hypothetical protein n=1 Tax=Aquihabitans sp. McL0605 TaxID=3415671 RepID=UPI003CED8471